MRSENGREGFTPADAEAILEEAASTPKQMKADELAKWLGVTYVERQKLGLTRIGAKDVGKRSRTILRKLRDRRAKERKRRERGARPRSEYEANSLSKTKPWEQLGLSRARWYRIGRPAVNEAETSPSTAVFLEAEETPVSGRARKGSSEEGGCPLQHLDLGETLWRGARSSPRRLSLHINRRLQNFGAASASFRPARAGGSLHL